MDIVNPVNCEGAETAWAIDAGWWRCAPEGPDDSQLFFCPGVPGSCRTQIKEMTTETPPMENPRSQLELLDALSQWDPLLRSRGVLLSVISLHGQYCANAEYCVIRFLRCLGLPELFTMLLRYRSQVSNGTARMSIAEATKRGVQLERSCASVPGLLDWIKLAGTFCGREPH